MQKVMQIRYPICGTACCVRSRMDALAVKDWLAIIGLSSLIATIVGHLFSSAREHQRWVYENKRLEWRELVDRFHQILHNIHYYRSGSGKDINILGDLNEGMLLL